jgi:tRNA A37 methylthiotransferase MiaB
VDADVISQRVARVAALAEELMSQRAEDRIGTRVDVLVEQAGDETTGRAAHQGPDVDGTTRLVGDRSVRPGQLVPGFVVDSDGVDLVADIAGAAW